MSAHLHTLIAPELEPRPPARTPVRNPATLLFVVAATLMIVVGVMRIVATYHVFSQTSDEPAHVATGMEWLQWHTYTFEPLHPPLARVAVAAGPYLAGLRLLDHRNLWIEGNELLLSHGDYLHNLALARMGVLPFFVLASFVVWYWSRRIYGDIAAVFAIFLFTTSPVVLAHAGLATTDMAAAATFTTAIFTFVIFLEQPSYFHASILGLATAAAILSKFSALVFLPVCGMVVLLIRYWMTPRTPGHASLWRRRATWARLVSVVVLVMVLIVWGGYRFTVSSATTAAARPHYSIDQVLGTNGHLHSLAYRVAELPFVPAPAFFQGIAKLRFKESVGHKSYLLGEMRQTGWWYFFPVALAVKSTIPFLIFAILGSFSLLSMAASPERSWAAIVPLVVTLTVLLVCMPSHINIGIRHILPLYPALAVVAGAGAAWLWNTLPSHHLGAALAMLLLVWQLFTSVRIHPDYLAYFNELSGSHPENILVGSDLDWGQDLLRLSSALQQRNIDHVSLAYAGSAHIDLTKFGLPPFDLLPPNQPVTGWVAISLTALEGADLDTPAGGFSRLDRYQPAELVGHSIRLYFIPSKQ